MGQSMLFEFKPGWLTWVRRTLELFDVRIASWIVFDMHLVLVIPIALGHVDWSNDLTSPYLMTIRGAWRTSHLIITWSYGNRLPCGYFVPCRGKLDSGRHDNSTSAR